MRQVRWLLIATGLIWIWRAALEGLAQPQYWNPQDASDYLAVALTTLALLGMGIGLFAFRRAFSITPKWASQLWTAGSLLILLDGVIGGVSNFLEDWLHLSPFGDLYVITGLIGVAGFLLVILATLFGKPLSKIIPLLYFLFLLGGAFPDDGGGYLSGAALITLAFSPGRK